MCLRFMLNICIFIAPAEDLFTVVTTGQRCDKLSTSQLAPVFKLPGDSNDLNSCAGACLAQPECVAFGMMSSKGTEKGYFIFMASV